MRVSGHMDPGERILGERLAQPVKELLGFLHRVISDVLEFHPSIPGTASEVLGGVEGPVHRFTELERTSYRVLYRVVANDESAAVMLVMFKESKSGEVFKESRSDGQMMSWCRLTRGAPCAAEGRDL